MASIRGPQLGVFIRGPHSWLPIPVRPYWYRLCDYKKVTLSNVMEAADQYFDALIQIY